MRTDLGPGHSRLKPPAVVGEGVVFPPIQGYLHPLLGARQEQRKRYRSFLRRPTITTAPQPFVAAPVVVTLAPSPRQARGSHQKLRPPTVIDLRPQTRYLSVNLSYSRRGIPKSRLAKPTVVFAPFVAAPVATSLAYSLRGRTMAGVRPPRFVGATITHRPVQVHLAVSSRGRPRSRLYSPTVIAAVGAAVYSGPKVTVARRPSRPVQQPVLGRPIVVSILAALGGVGVQLVQTPRTRTLHRLNPPTVVTAVVAAVYFGPQTALAYSRRGVAGPLLSPPAVINTDRYFGPATTLAPTVRTTTRSRLFPPTVTVAEAKAENTILVRLAPSTRGVAKSRLFAPQSVGEGVVFPPIFGTLFPLGYQNLPRAKSILRPPVVVTQPTPAAVYYGPSVHLARQVRTRTAAILRRPTVVDLTPQVFYVSVALTRIRPPAVHSRLSPSTVTEALLHAERDLRVTLAYSVRGKPTSILRKPAAIDLRPQAVYLSTALAYSRRGLTKSRLRPPAVTTTDRFFGPTVNLAPSRRPKARYGLAAPAVVFIPEPVLYPVAVTLAYSIRGKPRSRLGRPLVVGAVVYYGPAVNLAYSLRGRPKSVLRKPVVIDIRPQVRYLAVHLTYSRRGRAVYELKPPAVVRREAFTGPLVHLAYSRRGVPKSELRPPVVIDLRPQVFYLSVALARIKHPPTQSFLRPSQVTEALPKAERDLRVTLAYQSRGKSKSVLRKPTVIDLRPQTRFLSVTLAYSRRGQPKSELKPPAVVGRLPFAPVTVTLAYSRRGRAKPFRTVPTVVRPPFAAQPVTVHLAYSLRGKPRSLLRPPVLAAETFAGPFVHLAPSRFPKARYGLAPPAIVGAGIAFFGPQTTLVRIVPPPVEALLKRPTVVNTFIPPAGDVCGTDEPAADDCGTDQPVTDDVCGTDEPAFDVSGSDSPESRIVGSDTAVGDVCGTDEQST